MEIHPKKVFENAFQTQILSKYTSLGVEMEVEVGLFVFVFRLVCRQSSVEMIGRWPGSVCSAPRGFVAAAL